MRIAASATNLFYGSILSRKIRAIERSGDYDRRSIEEVAVRSVLFLVGILCSGNLLMGLLAAQQGPANAELRPGEPAAALIVPEAPSASVKRGKVIDKKFVFAMSALGAAESMSFTTRRLVLEHEYAAGAPWVTSVPPTRPMIAKDLGLYASELFVAYEMKKRHSWLPGDRVIRRLWWVYPVAMTVILVKNGVGNIRTQGPEGCTSTECAEQSQ